MRAVFERGTMTLNLQESELFDFEQILRHYTQTSSNAFVCDLATRLRLECFCAFERDFHKDGSANG